MQYVLYWFLIGAIAGLLGSLHDAVFYHESKLTKFSVLLCIMMGPFSFWILFNTMLLHLTGRKKK